MMWFRPFVFLPLLVVVVFSVDPAPSGASAPYEPPSCGLDECNCDVYWYDYMLFAGREFRKNEVLPTFSQEAVVRFQQHSRKAWPRWNRYHQLHQVKDKPYHFAYAPGAEWPLECHSRLYNTRLNITDNEAAARVYADKTITLGEPLFLDCPMPDRSVRWRLEDMFVPSISFLQDHAVCIDTLTIPGPGSALAKRTLAAGSTVAFGPTIHMHRSELWDNKNEEYEPLIDSAFGHPATDLLLLPNAPFFSSIPHNHTHANVELRWDFDPGDTPAAHFGNKPANVLFAEKEQASLWLKLVATRDIAPGDPVFLDAGAGWSSGQPRRVPDGFFPPSWLAQETIDVTFPSLLLPQLKPGQVRPVIVDTTNQPLGSMLNRVGLPPQLADTMQEWANETGLLDQLDRYVIDKTLQRGGEERFRVANGTWWTRRFEKSWQSDMHYIATDDDESNEQFFHALSRAGMDKVLQGVGQHFNLTQLTCFYPSYIVVSHCVNAHMHSDSDYDNIFNLILPIVQVDDGQPELILAEDEPGTLHVPYNYERDHGILVGKDGLHGTSPTDYRTGEEKSRRIVMSVYMGDFSDRDTLRQFMNDWEDPPYPSYWPGQLEHALGTRVHWKRDDPSITLADPLERAFPLRRPIMPRPSHGGVPFGAGSFMGGETE